MNILTIITLTLLISMSLFHFYWAFGGSFGIDKVIPTHQGKEMIKPGKVITIIVALILLGFAFVAYLLGFEPLYAQKVVTLGWILSALFILRAIGEFNSVGFFKKIKNTEFAKYDTRFFSPLCVFLGLVFALLSLQV